MKPYWKKTTATDGDANVFIQYSVLGNCTFEIRNDFLEITPAPVPGKKSTTPRVPLKEIAPDCERGRIRLPSSRLR
jgi:hypothetical protein